MKWHSATSVASDMSFATSSAHPSRRYGDEIGPSPVREKSLRLPHAAVRRPFAATSVHFQPRLRPRISTYSMELTRRARYGGNAVSIVFVFRSKRISICIPSRLVPRRESRCRPVSYLCACSSCTRPRSPSGPGAAWSFFSGNILFLEPCCMALLPPPRAPIEYERC